MMKHLKRAATGVVDAILVLVSAIASMLTGLVLLALASTLVQPAIAGLSETETTHRQFTVEPAASKAVVHVIEQELDRFLVLAARYNRYEVTFSGDVAGKLTNATLPMALDRLMPRLADRYDLTWTIEGRTLFVSPASRSETRTLSLEGLSPGQFSTLVEDTPVLARQFEVRLLDNGRFARLVAPASYLDAITARIERLRK